MGRSKLGDVEIRGAKIAGTTDLAGAATLSGATTLNGATTFNSSSIFLGTVPTTATSNGVAGQVALTVGNTATAVKLYVCYATNLWSQMSNFSNTTAFN